MNEYPLPAPNSFRNSASTPFRSAVVALPKSWHDALALVAVVDAEWEALDLDDAEESARVSEFHDQAMLAFLRTPAPDAAGLAHKLRVLHADGRIDAEDETVDQLCREIIALCE